MSTTTLPGQTSGTFNWFPSNADIFVEAFDRCGIRATAITRDMVHSARRSIDLLLVKWSNKGVNIWARDLQTINLLPPVAGVGVSQYPVLANTIQVLDCYYTIVNGGGPGINIDRLLLPMGETDYAELPDKLQPGSPTRYWFNRTIPPTLTIWQPDVLTGNQINFWRLRRLMDATPQMGEIPDVEYRFLDALAAGLAERLAEKFAPARLKEKALEATEAWDLAHGANRDDVPLTLSPSMAGYYRS